MVTNLKYLLELVRKNDWSGSELARRMGVSRTEANRLLNGQRVGGKKTIGGLMKAFPHIPGGRFLRLHSFLKLAMINQR